ncbi:MAG TPA: condensation domain-containing protein [Verrucomicrobiae bacterium]
MNGSPQLDNSIAIIGLAGRFPKARNVQEFWRNLQNGVEGISFFSEQELDEAGVIFPKGNSNYVKARALLDDADKFDAEFFGVTPKEAEIMDPQHRVFLECAWEALESSGYGDDTPQRMTGVFAGMSMNTYLLANLATHPELMELVGGYQTMLANDKDYLPTRVSYKLNLRGPSLNIQTACSTSLVSVCVACQHLLNFQCDMALAGGVSVSFPQKKGMLYQEGGISSPDGHCRAFDAKAQGTVPGDAAGVVVLKRFNEALADGDQIYGVIRGFAMNNDGSQKVGYTAPSEDGQAEVIALAQALAGVEPESISYVVTHGTGTPLGDPIEIAGLTKAYRAGTDQNNFCALTSVKSNIGHSDAAAGIAGLISAVLALHNEQIPPTLHFESPNPKIDFANSPFYVNARLKPWARNGTPRRAGVSSFGIGGTNAHVILEEAPARTAPSKPKDQPALLVLSAKTTTALDAATANLAAHLKQHAEISLRDAAYTLQTGRRLFAHRRAVVVNDSSDAINVLESRDAKRILTASNRASAGKVAFLFPGQGAQHVNMGGELYESEPVFRAQVDECCHLLKPHLGLDLRSVLFAPLEKAQEAQAQLTETRLTQPALFVIEYALAKLLMHWGIQPAAMLGHSIGEYVAACLAEVFSLSDALSLVALRGSLMQSLPHGSMLAVRLNEKEVQGFVTADISLAAVNSSGLCVLSGPTAAINSLQKILEGKTVASQLLHTSHAFHSAMMEPILQPFKEAVRNARPKEPTAPYVSNVTGTWVTADQTTDPDYWARHLRSTVRFADGLGTLLQDPSVILIEVGPGQTLIALARQHSGRSKDQILASAMRSPKSSQSDRCALLNAIANLWLAGVSMDWAKLYPEGQPQRVSLPTYPFERQRYFVEPARATNVPVIAPSGASIMNQPVKPASPQPQTKTLPLDPGLVAAPEMVLAKLKSHFSLLSGLPLGEIEPDVSFTEMGFDSLFLTQACQGIEKTFGIKIAFGQLLERFSTLNLLAAHIHQTVPSTTPNKSMAGLQNSTVSAAETPTSKSTPPAPSGPYQVPLTEAQKELWFAAQKGDDASCAFNESVVLSLRGDLKLDALQRAIQKLVDRHEGLRTIFLEGGEAQEILPAQEAQLQFFDLSNLETAEKQAQIKTIFEKASGTPFILTSGPLHRFAVILLEEGNYLFICTVHHLICDGSSLGVLLTEMSEFYGAECHGLAKTLPPAMQFGEYARLQEELKDCPERKRAEQFWLKQFETPPAVLDLSLDHPRPAEKTFKGATEVRQIRASLGRNLKRVSAQHGCTLFTTVLAAYYVLLHRLTGQNEIIVGIPSADRSGEGSERLVGHTVNFLPLRASLTGEEKFSDWLRQLRVQFWDAFEHQNYTFGTLLQKLNLPRDRSRMPLVSASFNLIWVRSGINVPGMETEIQPNPHAFANFDLTFNITEADGMFTLDCNYGADLFQPETIRRWTSYFEKLLETATQNPDARICDMPLLPVAERQKLLVEWNRSILTFPKDQSLQALFEEQATKTPNNVAIRFGATSWSYQALNERANQIAHWLIQTGISNSAVVALVAERKPEAIASLLGILKAGAAYVPLEAGMTSERLQSILAREEIQWILAPTSIAALLSIKRARVLTVDPGNIAKYPRDNPAGPTTPAQVASLIYADDLQCVVGVEFNHRSYVATAEWLKATFTPEELNGVLAASPFSQSAAILETFAPLCVGGSVVLVENLNHGLATGAGITMVSANPRHLRKALAQIEKLPESVRVVNIHGDVLPPQLVTTIHERGTVRKINHYYSAPEIAGFALGSARTPDARSVIGRPTANTQIYVVDKHLQAVPTGVVGELCIAGECVGQGYVNHQSPQSSAFVANPFKSETGGKLFRTGDLCRISPDGNVSFVGKSARQYFVRGYRQYAEDLEALLASHPDVEDCAIQITRGVESSGPVAYIVRKTNSSTGSNELRVWLKERQPEHLAPIAFVFLETLPVRPNGHIDYELLPEPTTEQEGDTKTDSTPLTPIQEILTQLWCEVIGLPEVGLHDNFFDLGGHSVLVTQIVARVRKMLRVNLTLRSVFDSPTVAELATIIEDKLMQDGEPAANGTAGLGNNRAELLPKT